MKASRHWLLVGVMLGSLIAASLCGFCHAQDQITKLTDAFGPDFRPTLREVQKLQDDALKLCYEGDVTQARSLLETALRVTENSLGANHRDVSLLLTSLAELCISEGELDKAQGFLRRSLEIAQANGGSEHPLVADALKVQASLNMVLGKNDEALSLCRRSLAIFEKAFGGEHITVGLCLCELADIYANQYRSREALAALERSRAIIQNVLGTGNFTLATVFDNLSTVYREQGDYKAALGFAKDSLKVREAFFGPSHPKVAESLAAVGWVCLYKEDYAEAERLFKRALAIFESGSDKDQRNVAVCLDKLVEIYWAEGDYAEALRLFDRSVGIKKKTYGENHPLVANSYETFGEFQQAIGKHEMALKSFGLCLKIRLDTLGKDHPSAANAVEHLGSVYLEMHDYTNALACFEGILPIREKAFGKEHPHVAVSLAHLAHFWYQFGQTLTNLNARKHCIAKSIGLQEQSIGILEKVCGADDPEVVTAKEYLAAMLLTDIARNLPQQSVLVDFIQYRRYDFNTKTSQWKEQRYAAYLIFPLTRDSTDAVVERVDLGEAAPINEAIGIIAKRFSAKQAQYLAKDLPPAFQRLSDLVYSPFAKHLTNSSRLIICPDGQLSRLPFEMLPVGNKFLLEEKTISYVTSGREVVRVAISRPNSKPQTQAGKSLVMGNPDFDFDLANARPSPNSAVQLAASPALRSFSRDFRGLKFKPLPGAEAEARSVAKLLGSDSALRLGAEAREAELKAVKSPRVLHLATHGFFLSDQEFKWTNSSRDSWIGNVRTRWNASLPANDWENPLVRCGIALAGANRTQQITNAIAEDGVLTGLEASLLNLHETELVILSACDSGTGEVKIGEGVMSLRRAFRIAGAETVLASHWSVSDKATSQLMTEFMRRWRGGEPRAKAWREAQLSLLRSKGAKEDFSNPFFWSAFTLTGQWR